MADQAERIVAERLSESAVLRDVPREQARDAYREVALHDADRALFSQSLPMQSDFEHAYHVSLEGGGVLDTAWIIEFSDVVFGHRWAADVLRLSVAGRTCPELTTSQHDRRFLWAGVSDSDHLGPSAWGRGACTTYSDMPHVYCALSSSSAGVPLPSCGGCFSG